MITHPLLDHPRWSAVMQACAEGRETSLRIALGWEVFDISAADCRSLVAGSIVKR